MTIDDAFDVLHPAGFVFLVFGHEGVDFLGINANDLKGKLDLFLFIVRASTADGQVERQHSFEGRSATAHVFLCPDEDIGEEIKLARLDDALGVHFGEDAFMIEDSLGNQQAAAGQFGGAFNLLFDFEDFGSIFVFAPLLVDLAGDGIELVLGLNQRWIVGVVLGSVLEDFADEERVFADALNGLDQEIAEVDGEVVLGAGVEKAGEARVFCFALGESFDGAGVVVAVLVVHFETVSVLEDDLAKASDFRAGHFALLGPAAAQLRQQLGVDTAQQLDVGEDMRDLVARQHILTITERLDVHFDDEGQVINIVDLGAVHLFEHALAQIHLALFAGAGLVPGGAAETGAGTGFGDLLDIW